MTQGILIFGVRVKILSQGWQYDTAIFVKYFYSDPKYPKYLPGQELIFLVT